jgi:uncharacterized repeat protein (TIGR01451 family)
MTKWWIGLALIGSAWPTLAQNNTSIPTLSCLSKSSEFNTAYDTAAAQKLTAGASDPQWFVTSYWPGGTAVTVAPPATATWHAAVVPNVTFPASWGSFADAQWLSPRLDMQSASGTWWGGFPGQPSNPYYNYYRFQFNLAPEVPPSAVTVQMSYLVDDLFNGAFVNGVYTSVSTGSLITGQWQSGLNSLIFSTGDIGWASGFAARATVASQSICTVSPLRITKQADKTQYAPGDTATYSVTLTSLGLVAAQGVQLTDPVPAGLSNPQWSCSASGGATCPSAPVTFPVTVDLPGQGALTFTLTGVVTGQASLDNVATISSPGVGGICAADTGCSAAVSPAYIAAAPTTGGSTPVPVPGPGLLVLAGLSLLMCALTRSRHRA